METFSPERTTEILKRIDRYNSNRRRGVPLSPFTARRCGKLGKVARRMHISVKELDEFLSEIEREFIKERLTV